MTEPNSPLSSDDRALLIRMVLNRCRGQLAAGEDLDESAIAAERPDLMPELGAELHKLLMIEKAKRQAEQADEIDETIGMAGATRSDKPKRIRYFGDYELIEEIARGGMGVVYKARQVSLNRIVAVKMILSGQLATDEDVKRFHTEAEAAANLDHPNIVPIYEVGDHDGQHYFSMAYVEGRGLDEMIRENPLSGKVAAECMKKVAEAIQYAHEQGVVHRDLKPSNILIDEKDQPRITDFGLAKQVGSDSDLTATGQILGTPSYMPPEQALGDQAQIGPQSDVYALGAVLYCLITGRPPFVADSPTATLMQVIQDEPVAPRQLNPSIDRDLETISLKCLEKNPDRRYATCGDLAAEFDRYLDGKPIIARPISRPAKAWRWCRRNPVVAGLCAAFVLLLIATSVITSTFAISERAARERERQAQDRVVTEQRENDRKRAASLVEAVLTAPAQAVPFAIQNVEPLRKYAIPILNQRLLAEGTDPIQRLHAAMALAHFGQVKIDALVDGIPVAPAGELYNIVVALKHAKQSYMESLREQAKKCEADGDWPMKYRYAIVGIHGGDTSLASEMCALRPDPVQRTMFIETFPKWHAVGDLAMKAEGIDDPALRSAVCLGVGSIPPAVLDTRAKEMWRHVLADWYETASDTGTHSAAGWALRQWGAELPAIPASTVPTEGRDWYHNTVGMTMLRIPAGSLDCEDSAGTVRRLTVEQPFLLSDREVTVGQFQAFMDDATYPPSDKPQDWKGAHKRHSPTEDHPVPQVSWYEAVMFCNWLSQKETLSPCYRGSGSSSELVSGATGYRFLTEAEWEYACRAGTTTEFACGNTTFLGRYSVYGADRSEVCGTKLPNGWGLFDMHGNVSEWCQDVYGQDVRVLRGGSFANNALNVRAAYRYGNRPDNRAFHYGFRPARTYR